MEIDLQLEQISPVQWLLPKQGEMRVPGTVFAGTETIESLKQDVASGKQWNALSQVRNVACLPGIVSASIGLPDIHPGYGFPIGGVAAFDIVEGVAVVGGVGFDINCGVRLLSTPLKQQDIDAAKINLADKLFHTVPAGLGSEGKIRLTISEIDRVLRKGARYAVEQGYGTERDLAYIEEQGVIAGADPSTVSKLAKQRQFRQVGTLGSGNHYVEVQLVTQILDQWAATVYGLQQGQIVISIHTGSRALGHQIGQDYLKIMEKASKRYNIPIRERELVCAPITSSEGEQYLSAVACGSNCAFANRQVIAHLVREVINEVFNVDKNEVRTVCDIGHNNAKREEHVVNGKSEQLLVHRKGATRAFGPGRKESPTAYQRVGHPILVGGTMGTASYVMRGTQIGMNKVFGSGIHGAGRALSRRKASKKYWGEDIKNKLESQGIAIRAHSIRGIAEEAPGAYKDVERVVKAATDAQINQPVAKLSPLIVIKG